MLLPVRPLAVTTTPSPLPPPVKLINGCDNDDGDGNDDGVDRMHCCTPARAHAPWYLSRWGKDVIVDLVSYRRNGHNELDDPRATQPLTCAAIEAHPPVLDLYGRQLMVRS